MKCYNLYDFASFLRIHRITITSYHLCATKRTRNIAHDLENPASLKLPLVKFLFHDREKNPEFSELIVDHNCKYNVVVVPCNVTYLDSASESPLRERFSFTCPKRRINNSIGLRFHVPRSSRMAGMWICRKKRENMQESPDN